MRYPLLTGWKVVPLTRSFFGAIVLTWSLVSCSRTRTEDQTTQKKDDHVIENSSGIPVTPSFNNCAELLAWRKDHISLFRSRKSIQDRDVSIEYLSPYCIACLEQPKASLTDRDLLARIAALDSTFQLVLRTSTVHNEEEPDSDALYRNTKLIVRGDTLDCAFLHLEPTPDMVPYRTHILGFISPVVDDGAFSVNIGPSSSMNSWSFDFSGTLKSYLQVMGKTHSKG